MTRKDSDQTGRTPGTGQEQQKQYRCERCHTSFNTREELDRHEQQVHQGEMEPGRR